MNSPDDNKLYFTKKLADRERALGDTRDQELRLEEFSRRREVAVERYFTFPVNQRYFLFLVNQEDC